MTPILLKYGSNWFQYLTQLGQIHTIKVIVKSRSFAMIQG